MREISSDTPFYFTDNFVEMTLQGEHHGNTDLRDAFRGSADISLAASIAVHTPDTVDVTMQRPLAKYEFISTDLKEFIDKEVQNALARGEVAEVAGDKTPSRDVDTPTTTRLSSTTPASCPAPTTCSWINRSILPRV